MIAISFSKLTAKLKRGHLAHRTRERLTREIQTHITGLTLRLSTPVKGRAAIVTLNADEENASVTAALLAVGLDPLTPLNLHGATEFISRPPAREVLLLSPDPKAASQAVSLAARQFSLQLPSSIRYGHLNYWSLLRAYRDAEETYSTHVLLPGIDRTGKRKHVHLTHGSGPKPDTTFRGPTNLLASITPHWIESQLREYKLPSSTETIAAMPRLAVMRKAAADASVAARLDLEPEQPLAVWAPTYRSVVRGAEKRISGLPFHNRGSGQFGQRELMRVFREHGWQLVAKVHPHEAETFGGFEFPVFTNSLLLEHGVTPYELFGASDLLITDYSSLLTERAALRLPFALSCPDLEEFAGSYRGFREPFFTDLYEDALIRTPNELAQLIGSLSTQSIASLGNSISDDSDVLNAQTKL